MQQSNQDTLAGYAPAPLENWYRHHYFNNSVDISGSGVEEYTFQQILQIAGFSFSELDPFPVKDCETVGSARITQQIADRFGVGDPDMVMITNGSNEALQLTIRSILTPGDEIITQGPCYHCHDKIAAAMGCSIQKWCFSAEDDFSLNLHQLRTLITERTKAIVLNFPHNPTGVSISQDMLDSTLHIIRDSDLFLVWDAAFQQLIYDRPALIDPIHNYRKTITVGTFSKAYGAPGLRFGWLVAPVDLIASCVRQKDYGNLYVASITEFVADKMLQRLDSFSKPRLEQATTNRDVVANWAKRDAKDIHWRTPDGGVCGLLKLPAHTDDTAFCKDLLAKHGVLLVPGSCFDMPGYVRLGFGGNTDQLTEGLNRLSTFLEEAKWSIG